MRDVVFRAKATRHSKKEFEQARTAAQIMGGTPNKTASKPRKEIQVQTPKVPGITRTLSRVMPFNTPPVATNLFNLTTPQHIRDWRLDEENPQDLGVKYDFILKRIKDVVREKKKRSNSQQFDTTFDGVITTKGVHIMNQIDATCFMISCLQLALLLETEFKECLTALGRIFFYVITPGTFDYTKRDGAFSDGKEINPVVPFILQQLFKKYYELVNIEYPEHAKDQTDVDFVPIFYSLTPGSASCFFKAISRTLFIEDLCEDFFVKDEKSITLKPSTAYCIITYQWNKQIEKKFSGTTIYADEKPFNDSVTQIVKTFNARLHLLGGLVHLSAKTSTKQSESHWISYYFNEGNIEFVDNSTGNHTKEKPNGSITFHMRQYGDTVSQEIIFFCKKQDDSNEVDEIESAIGKLSI